MHEEQERLIQQQYTNLSVCSLGLKSDLLFYEKKTLLNDWLI
jgi:hypothetical protein